MFCHCFRVATNWQFHFQISVGNLWYSASLVPMIFAPWAVGDFDLAVLNRGHGPALCHRRRRAACRWFDGLRMVAAAAFQSGRCAFRLCRRGCTWNVRLSYLGCVPVIGWILGIVAGVVVLWLVWVCVALTFAGRVTWDLDDRP